MKVALVHDYIKEFGGAERVLRVLADMFPRAPIYTAFRVAGSSCDKEFSDRKIVESSWAFLLRHFNLYSPFRFLAPVVWGSFDLSSYDLVISSSSSYFARGFRFGEKTKVVVYCHTPPRFLYGYETSINLQKYWIVRVYSVIVNHFLRVFDFWSASKISNWIVNSENVQRRVGKFYRKESVVIYPPVEVEKMKQGGVVDLPRDYFLVVSRLVGAKGLVEAAKAATSLGFKLKIVGESVGFSAVKSELLKFPEVELLGRVKDSELGRLYGGARGFLALAKDEDFGITPVEAMAAGTPVIAFNGGGFRETVVDGKTGILVNEISEKSLASAMKRFSKTKWNKRVLVSHSEKFSRRVFEKKIREYLKNVITQDA